MSEKRQDTVRFAFRFPGDADAIEYELAAIRRIPCADFPLVHRLTQEELGDVLAKLGWEHVRSLAQRVTELQAIVDKRKDEREWDSIQELFHPDMNIADIHAAITELLAVFHRAQKHRKVAIFFGPTDKDPGVLLDESIDKCNARLWGNRPTQLEKDEAVSAKAPAVSEEPTHPTRRQAVDAAVALWDLLDKIDSLGDEIKPESLDDYKRLYRRTMGLTSLRTQHMVSDGHVLLWPLQATPAVPPAPVSLLLHCPVCHTKHIDEGEFATKPHHTHACQGWVVDDGKRRRCGHVWRPALVATVGVEALPGFVNEPELDGQALVGARVTVTGGATFSGTITSYDAAASDGRPYFIKYENGGYRARRSEFQVEAEDLQVI